jgi:hypothetical protein
MNVPRHPPRAVVSDVGRPYQERGRKIPARLFESEGRRRFSVLAAVLSATALLQYIDPVQLSEPDPEILCRRVWNLNLPDPPIAHLCSTVVATRPVWSSPQHDVVATRAHRLRGRSNAAVCRAGVRKMPLCKRSLSFLRVGDRRRDAAGGLAPAHGVKREPLAIDLVSDREIDKGDLQLGDRLLLEQTPTFPEQPDKRTDLVSFCDVAERVQSDTLRAFDEIVQN